MKRTIVTRITYWRLSWAEEGSDYYKRIGVFSDKSLAENVAQFFFGASVEEFTRDETPDLVANIEKFDAFASIVSTMTSDQVKVVANIINGIGRLPPNF